MDVKDTCSEARENADMMSDCVQTLNARGFARMIYANYNFEINVAGTLWKGDIRMWENVCAWSTRLPNGGRANCVLEAMRRYPCSGLVYYGLKTVFGKSMVIGRKRIPRIPLGKDAIALFSPFATSKKSLKEWFENSAHVRIQETVVHMCAVSEYILRCSLISRQKEGPTTIFSMMEERIKQELDYRNRDIMRFRPWNILDELSDEDACICLRNAMWIGHSATLEGAKAARRNYARKKVHGKDRKKLKLWMLSRPLPEILDSVVRQLESVIKEQIGIDLDVDEFRLHMTRLLRKVETIYESVGLSELREDVEARIPDDLRDNGFGLPLPEPYRFVYSR
ncbi:hypothetical protein FGB62_22g129 [Gracilaria domingensis]|nr:hypothetical protein FGB62_22g129 [Gracilaria domingensis]